MPVYYPPDQPKILMVSVPPQTTGPLPLLTQLLAEGLQALGYTVTLATCWGHKKDGESLLGKIIGRFTDIGRILLQARRDRYALIYIHSSHDPRTLLRDIPLAAGLHIQKAPVVIIFHGSELKRLADHRDRWFAWGTALLFRLVAAVLVDSTEEQKTFQQLWPWARVGVVPQPMALNPVDETMTGQEPTQIHIPILLFAGRLIPEKGVLDVLGAFIQVRARVNCKLIIAGEGVLRAELERMAREDRDLSDAVEFTGYIDRSRMWAVYRRADILVLPTYHAEGMPTVILEAMASGLGIICTPIRGAADYLQEGENVFFVPPCAPDILANRMMNLLTHPGALGLMKDNNRRLARNFEPTTAASRQIAVIQSFGLLAPNRKAVMDGPFNE